MARSHSIGGWVFSVLLVALATTLIACSTTRQRPVAPVAAPAAGVDTRSLPLRLDPRVLTGTFGNGVTYYLQRHDVAKKRALLSLMVKAGSVYEAEDERGLAHFVEHMAFNGTRRFAKRSLVDFFEKVGMAVGHEANAFTQPDRTQYWLSIPTEDPTLLATALDVLEDWASGIAFDEDEVTKERPVLLSEWLTRQGAAQREIEQHLRILTAGSRFAEREPKGTRSVIEQASREQLRNFYRCWYRPERMAVIAVGDIEPEATRSAIEQRFAKLAAVGQAAPPPDLDIPVRPGVRATVISDAELQATNAAVVIKLAATPPRTVADLQQQLVTTAALHALRQRIAELASHPDAPLVGINALHLPGMFGRLDVLQVSAQAQDGQVRETMRALLTEMERVRQHGFTPGEVRREIEAFARWLDHQVAAEDTVPALQIAANLANQFVTGSITLSAEDQRAIATRMLRTLRGADLVRSLDHYYRNGELHLVVSGPAPDRLPDKDELLAIQLDIAKQPLADYSAPSAPPQLMPVLPTPGRITGEQHIAEIDTTVWSLSNGAKVVLKPTDFKSDEVLEQSVSYGGFSLATSEAFSSIRVAHEIVSASGVGSLDRQALARALARKVVSVYPWIGEQDAGIRGRSSPRDVETLFQLIHLYATAPRKDVAAFENYRASLRERLRHRDLNPAVALDDAIAKSLWGGEPRRMLPTLQSTTEIDLDRALDFYRQRFADVSGFTFVFVGRIDLPTFKPLVERYLASLPGIGHRETIHDLGIHRRKGITRVVTQAGRDEKATFELIYHGESPWSENAHTDLDSTAGYLSIRLPELLREEMGGVYSVRVDSDFYRIPFDAYALSIRFDCKPSDLKKLVDTTHKVIAEIKKSGVPASYVDKIKAQRTRNLEGEFRTNEMWLERFVEKFKMHEDPRDIYILHQLTNRVTSDNIRAAARHFLRDDQYVDARRLPSDKAE